MRLHGPLLTHAVAGDRHVRRATGRAATGNYGLAVVKEALLKGMTEPLAIKTIESLGRVEPARA